MAWIESHQTLREHPKLYAFMAAANVSRSAAVGHLHLLWWWAIDYAMDGNIRADENAIARAADWPGDAKLFVGALVMSGFIDSDENGMRLHDWPDYCGQLIEKRLKRLADKRRKTAAVRRPKVPVRTPTQPNPTVPNPTQPNHEERGANGSRKARPSHPRTSLITPEWIEALKGEQTYAGLDVDRELGKMRQWCLANGKGESRRRFVNWLNRAEWTPKPEAPRDEPIPEYLRRELPRPPKEPVA